MLSPLYNHEEGMEAERDGWSRNTDTQQLVGLSKHIESFRVTLLRTYVIFLSNNSRAGFLCTIHSINMISQLDTWYHTVTIRIRKPHYRQNSITKCFLAIHLNSVREKRVEKHIRNNKIAYTRRSLWRGTDRSFFFSTLLISHSAGTYIEEAGVRRGF